MWSKRKGSSIIKLRYFDRKEKRTQTRQMSSEKKRKEMTKPQKGCYSIIKTIFIIITIYVECFAILDGFAIMQIKVA